MVLAPSDELTGQDILNQGPCNSFKIDTAVGVKFSVFRSDQGCFEIGGNTVEGNRIPFFQIQFGQQLLFGGINAGNRLGPEGLQGSNLGQIAGECEKRTD